MRAWIVVVALSAGVWCTPAAAAPPDPDELVVLVHGRNPTPRITRAELRAMLMGNRFFWRGVVPVKPVVRSAHSAVGKRVFAEILGMEPGQYAAHWTARQLAGQGMAPESVAGALDVAARVSAAPGGIGVVSRAEVRVLPSTVKVIPLEK